MDEQRKAELIIFYPGTPPITMFFSSKLLLM